MAERIGKRTIRLEHAPVIHSFAAVGSKMESEGPLAGGFDLLNRDSMFGEDSWEKAESAMVKCAVQKALEKGGVKPQEVDMIFAGDLLNQCASSSYGLRSLGIPFMGLYGACSTMAESLICASLFVEGGLARLAAAATSSHFCSAERQFRFPLEYGGQRPPTAQWTATAAGCAVVSESGAFKEPKPPFVRQVCIGTIEDLGITDQNNMGAAMAPAAAQTLLHFFQDTGASPSDFDRIFTGDLGAVGSTLLLELLGREGYDLTARHEDCGLLLYDREAQDVHAGASGCGCSAAVLCSYILPALREGAFTDVLFMATGALMSTTTVQQGESIPGIAHLLHLSARSGKEGR